MTQLIDELEEISTEKLEVNKRADMHTGSIELAEDGAQSPRVRCGSGRCKCGCSGFVASSANEMSCENCHHPYSWHD